MDTCISQAAAQTLPYIQAQINFEETSKKARQGETSRHKVAISSVGVAIVWLPPVDKQEALCSSRI